MDDDQTYFQPQPDAAAQREAAGWARWRSWSRSVNQKLATALQREALENFAKAVRIMLRNVRKQHDEDIAALKAELGALKLELQQLRSEQALTKQLQEIAARVSTLETSPRAASAGSLRAV